RLGVDGVAVLVLADHLELRHEVLAQQEDVVARRALDVQAVGAVVRRARVGDVDDVVGRAGVNTVVVSVPPWPSTSTVSRSGLAPRPVTSEVADGVPSNLSSR